MIRSASVLKCAARSNEFGGRSADSALRSDKHPSALRRACEKAATQGATSDRRTAEATEGAGVSRPAFTPARIAAVCPRRRKRTSTLPTPRARRARTVRAQRYNPTARSSGAERRKREGNPQGPPAPCSSSCGAEAKTRGCEAVHSKRSCATTTTGIAIGLRDRNRRSFANTFAHVERTAKSGTRDRDGRRTGSHCELHSVLGHKDNAGAEDDGGVWKTGTDGRALCRVGGLTCA
ncbi:hypothetical protein FGB62_305g011 [Gracilaria domingensis]|nr:hypothetical protein FGB62_305g011 [Gracilaria domingensis]